LDDLPRVQALNARREPSDVRRATMPRQGVSSSIPGRLGQSWRFRGQDRLKGACIWEKIIQLTESEFASARPKRIAHLGSSEMRLVPAQAVRVPEGVQNLTLLRDHPQMAPAERIARPLPSMLSIWKSTV